METRKIQGGGTQCLLYSNLRPRSSLDLWLLLKLCLTFVQSLVNFCKITFTQLFVKYGSWFTLYKLKSMLHLWPTKILPWLLTFALTEDEDQSTGYIGVPPPWLCMHLSMPSCSWASRGQWKFAKLNCEVPHPLLLYKSPTSQVGGINPKFCLEIVWKITKCCTAHHYIKRTILCFANTTDNSVLIPTFCLTRGDIDRFIRDKSVTKTWEVLFTLLDKWETQIIV